MIEKFNYLLSSKQPVSFIIDNDIDLKWLADFDASPYNRFYVIIDSFVEAKYGWRLKQALQSHAKKIYWIKLESKESVKSLTNYANLVKRLEEKGLNRYDVLIGVGGGILIDIVSFTASTYMRGVPLILVPTTLVGQVDAATAGKTCLNSPRTKNLVGTLYFAKYVYNNIRFLDSLDIYNFRQGMSEIFKYALLGAPLLLKLLLEYQRSKEDKVLFKIIRGTIAVRMKLRKQDPLASNLGHTFGHAIEKMSNYRIAHGDAISFGILMAVNFGRSLGLTPERTAKEVEAQMKRLGLNVRYDPAWTTDELIELMRKDKKASDKKINLVLLSKIGRAYHDGISPFYAAEVSDIEKFLPFFFEKFSLYSNKNLPIALRGNQL